MKLSRTRLVLSSVLGLSLAIVALTMATLLDRQGDPALDQSTRLRQQFTPPAGTTDPVDSLRTPKPAPRAQEVQLAAPATPAAPAAPAISADDATPVAVASLDAVRGDEHAQGDDEQGDDDAFEGGDD